MAQRGNEKFSGTTILVNALSLGLFWITSRVTSV